MTDRITRLTVVLEQDIRDDDCQRIIDAIMCIRGIASVTGKITDFDAYDARNKVRMELRSEIIALLEKLKKCEETK